MISKQEADKIMQMKGEVKGVVFQTDREYVKKMWGQESLDKIKKELKKLGYPIEYEKVKALEWHPIGLRVLSLLVIKDSFNMSDEDIKIMGNTAPKLSFIVKLLLRFFVNLKMSFEHASEMWTKHYSVGKLRAEIYEAENWAKVYLEDIKLHPMFCKYLEGYFSRIVQYTINKNIKSEEEKCMFKGGPCHEYKISWE